ncbi:MAG: hypothetical protein K2J85_02860 [Anaeroplasmataceae bacterium]|nr:hypothetical protein [Anaeroplasmataceae bacterium]
MKKKLLLAGVAALSVATLASCGGGTQKRPQVEVPDNTVTAQVPEVTNFDTTSRLSGKTMNMYLNYKAKSGVTYTGNESKLGAAYQNPIDGKTYTRGDLMPMWSEVQTKLGVTIKDAVWDFTKDAYTQDSEDKIYTAIGSDSNLESIDIMMTNSANAVKYAKDDHLVNLADYFQYMPNLYNFFKAHPSVYSEMVDANGNLYMAPYFDGLDSVEKMFIFNTELVEKLLDEENPTFDETPAKATVYEPFINTSKDYQVIISDNGTAKDLTVKAATNPVAAQNALATKNGKTYAQALRDYIDKAYMGSNEYAKRSEVFTSEKACYSTDDMIALMRCAVNNSVYLYGAPDKVHGIVPRGQANNRVITILQMAQIWGIRGLSSEKDMLYYNNKGKLVDLRTSEEGLDALDKLHQLKEEGLIIDGWDAEGSKNGTFYYQYLTGASGAALMIYDYNATQVVNNKLDATTGIGTSSSIYNGLRPVLPPVTDWKDNYINDNKYLYTRYTEDSRAFKSAGSVVFKKTNNEDQIIAACQLIDFFYGKDGASLQDYGPAAYTDGKITVAGVEYAKIKTAVFNAINESKLGWNDWMRDCVGTTQGMGHVRSDGLDYQVTHPVGQVGLQNFLSAVASGAVVCATTARPAGFGATVPAYYSQNATTTDIATLVDFWKQGMGDTAWRSVINHGWTTTTKEDLRKLWSQSDEVYLDFYNDYLANKVAKA